MCFPCQLSSLDFFLHTTYTHKLSSHLRHFFGRLLLLCRSNNNNEFRMRKLFFYQTKKERLGELEVGSTPRVFLWYFCQRNEQNSIILFYRKTQFSQNFPDDLMKFNFSTLFLRTKIDISLRQYWISWLKIWFPFHFYILNFHNFFITSTARDKSKFARWRNGISRKTKVADDNGTWAAVGIDIS